MRRSLLSALTVAFAASCLTPVAEVIPVPDAGGCPAGEDCGNGEDAGCPLGSVCPACDAGLTLVDGACVAPTPGVDAGPDGGNTTIPDSGPIGTPDSGPVGQPDSGPIQLDAGLPCFSGTLTDAESKGPVAGATISALDLSGNPIPGASTQSAANGSFDLCPPPGATFTTDITAAGYPTTYIESVTLSAPQKVSNVPMLSSQIIGEASLILTGFNTQDATILAAVTSASGGCSAAGWSFAASLPGGGALAYKIAYLGSSGLPSPGATSTSSEGVAVLYNIDPTVATQVAVSASNPGATCSSENGTIGFTGQVQVAASALSVAPTILP